MANETNTFTVEKLFEQSLAELLINHGWEKEIIMNPTEEDLVKNWADIIYNNNREREKLGNYPLTESEMRQVVDKVNMCASPYELNKLINGKNIQIKRDNQQDKNNYGKDVYLKIFDAKEICAGQSRYQIVRQPRFKTSSAMLGERRGDVMLLINGMPVVHIELKRSGVDVSQAVGQIKRYVHEGVFSKGIYSLVQIFVAMTPEKTLYFANPGAEDNFKPEFQFHWADYNNTEITDWSKVAIDLLSIPMAHQMVGDYTIADDKDKTLKVLRSYQYFAVNKICDRVHSINWDNHHHRGGYIWHTTGSGKTMTSFKAAQIIANSGDADKVVFLLDRIELSIQSLEEFRGFAGDEDTVQDTKDTGKLVAKLKSTDNDDKLIVTSINKMSNVVPGDKISQEDIDLINKKRLVLVIDECHRSVYGTMLQTIKDTFPRALLFGFTGTPVVEENAKNEIETKTLFGDELHKYSIANAIPDKNVLAFDPYMVTTYKEEEVRRIAAMNRLKIKSLDEIEGDEEKMKVYEKFTTDLPMESDYEEDAVIKHGVEHYLPADFYRKDIHHRAVAADIYKNWDTYSRNSMFHAILATENIPEAIEYYKLFRENYPSLNVVAIFDDSIDNNDDGIYKEDSIQEMLDHYNRKYGTQFGLPQYLSYKKDVAKRLAHKKPYIGIENNHKQQIDLLIVVTQMLTGYDSKWINTLYVDKELKYVDLIQAFSRTNRLFGHEKPYGIIKYYAWPYTMRQNIKDALKVYVDRPLGVFVDKLETNLINMNAKFRHIKEIFEAKGIENFSELPDSKEDRMMFAQDFCDISHLLEKVRLQGFKWDKTTYEFEHGDHYTTVEMEFDEETYMTLLQRYRELFPKGEGGEGWQSEYPEETYLVETGTGTIDAEYINSKFQRFIKNLFAEGANGELTKQALKELHKSFATMSQEDQKTAKIIIHDIQTGDIRLEAGKTIQDYINEYQLKQLYQQIRTLCEATGLSFDKMKDLMTSNVNEQNLNDFNRFDNLKLTLDNLKTRAFIAKVEGVEDIKARYVMPKADALLRKFILDGDERKKILQAYLNDGEAVVSDVEDTEDETLPEDNTIDFDKIRDSITALLGNTLGNVGKNMRDVDEIVNSVFYVISTKANDSLDSVGMFVARALTNIYVKKPTIVDKFVSFNLLVTKFEAYLKKLYFMINGKDVEPQYKGDDATWKDAIHSFNCLWNLKYSDNPDKQNLYQCLEMMKVWRNEESHISPTTSEADLDKAIGIVVTMYFYATGSNITELESAGHDIEEYSHILS